MTEARPLDFLLSDISKHGQAFTEYLSSNSYYQPSFRPGGLTNFQELPNEVQLSRKRLAEAAKAVYELATTPAEYIRSLSSSYHDASTLRWLLHFRIPEAVPLLGAVTYQQIADTCDVDEPDLRRILRYAMTNKLFYEPSEDEVAHTPFSSALVTDTSLRASIHFDVEEGFDASSELTAAFDKWELRDEPNRTAWCLSNKSDLSIPELLAEEEPTTVTERLAQSISRTQEAAIQQYTDFIMSSYDWAAVPGNLVVVGNSSATLASSDLRPVIFDLPQLISLAEPNVPDGLKNQVRFEAGAFWQPLPEILAKEGFFVMPFLLHQFSDKSVRRILRNFIEPLKRSGATLIVIDTIIPAPGAVSPEMEHALRAQDMRSMVAFGGKARELEEWEPLFQQVDRRLTVKLVAQADGVGILQVRLKQE